MEYKEDGIDLARPTIILYDYKCFAFEKEFFYYAISSKTRFFILSKNTLGLLIFLHSKKVFVCVIQPNFFPCSMYTLTYSETEFKEFEPRLKSARNRFQLSVGLYLANFEMKWNQPYLSRGLNLSRGSNSLNSASD